INRMDTGDKKASTDMIMLTVISATSLQILPTTVIGMRATAGSANPADFLFPSLIATVLSTFIGIVGVKLCAKIFDRPRKNRKTEISTATPLGGVTATQKPRRARAKPDKPKKQKRIKLASEKRKAVNT
ncbi:MAG: hypothetical protein OSJ83_13870, partial [Clostridia bacterium]|nr:hypothetical protein [Clostridia bacterium]